MPTTPTGPAPQASRRPSPRRRRTTARILHLAAAGVLGVFIYAPAAVTGPLRPGCSCWWCPP